MREYRWLPLIIVLMSLGGCTTLASKVEIAPPGTNKYSFRECLLDRGFYSRQALTGIALDDWYLRHDLPRYQKRDTKGEYGRLALLEQRDFAFVKTAAIVIADGVMPAEEYWDPRHIHAMSEKGVADGDGQARYYGDNVAHAPYVDLPASQRYPDQAKGNLSMTQPVALSRGFGEASDWRLNRFLDCYIAPVGVIPGSNGGTKASGDDEPAEIGEHGDEDLEGRLLRGHILLALLGEYGTELVISHPSGRQVAQAELLLGHLKDAENSLRNTSLIMSAGALATANTVQGFVTATGADGKAVLLIDGKPAQSVGGKPVLGPDGKAKSAKLGKLAIMQPAYAPGKPVKTHLTLAWADYTTRLLRVFQVGVDIERIDAQQTLDRMSNLIAAFSGPVKGFLPILKDGLSGAITVQKIKLYGSAYLRDARESLAIARENTERSSTGTWTYDVPVMTQEWNLWDKQLADSCKLLATLAKKDPASAVCIPKSAGGDGS